MIFFPELEVNFIMIGRITDHVLIIRKEISMHIDFLVDSRGRNNKSTARHYYSDEIQVSTKI